MRTHSVGYGSEERIPGEHFETRITDVTVTMNGHGLFLDDHTIKGAMVEIPFGDLDKFIEFVTDRRARLTEYVSK